MTPFNVENMIGKRKRGPSPPPVEISTTRSGRSVTRHDYKRLHAGAAIQPADPRSLSDPKTIQEAFQQLDKAEWKNAAMTELKSLEQTGTFKRWLNRKDLPPNARPMRGKWVFKKKLKPNGDLDKYKARWTAKGFTQRYGIDFQETFAPTPIPGTARLLLALQVQFGLKRKQCDAETAFLNPKVDVRLFIEAPEGMEELMPKRQGMIIELGKGIYGLKQAAYLWRVEAFAAFSKLGLKPTRTDPCLFMGENLLVLIHVDDFQAFSYSQKRIDQFFQDFNKMYTVKETGKDHFLSLAIDENKDYIKISQEHYAKEKLRNHDLLECRTVKWPLDELLEPYDQEGTLQDYQLYNKIVGELQWLANQTRPDITHAVNHLAKFLQNPGPRHVAAGKHVWRYIAGNPGKGLTFRKQKEMALEAYSDSDFADMKNKSRSTTGCLITFNGTPILWKSALQKEVVLSSTEAEYMALTHTSRGLRLITNILDELRPFTGLDLMKGIKTFVDNKSTICLVNDHVDSKRTRHVSLRNHYCKEQQEQGNISVQYINTKLQKADGLTKVKSPNLHFL